MTLTDTEAAVLRGLIESWRLGLLQQMKRSDLTPDGRERTKADMQLADGLLAKLYREAA